MTVSERRKLAREWAASKYAIAMMSSGLTPAQSNPRFVRDVMVVDTPRRGDGKPRKSIRRIKPRFAQHDLCVAAKIQPKKIAAGIYLGTAKPNPRVTIETETKELQTKNGIVERATGRFYKIISPAAPKERPSANLTTITPEEESKLERLWEPSGTYAVIIRTRGTVRKTPIRVKAYTEDHARTVVTKRFPTRALEVVSVIYEPRKVRCDRKYA